METKELNIGDKVQVISLPENGVGRPKQLHYGVVVALTTSAAKVYRPKRNDEDTAGDVEPATAEYFAINGKLQKVIPW